MIDLKMRSPLFRNSCLSPFSPLTLPLPLLIPLFPLLLALINYPLLPFDHGKHGALLLRLPRPVTRALKVKRSANLPRAMK